MTATHCRRCGNEQTHTKYGRRCYACERAQKRNDSCGRDREGTRKLPVRPMLPWLLERIDEFGDKPTAADALNVSARRLYAWTKGESTAIHLDVADRMFCAAGDPQLLYVFWPELVPQEVAA